MSYERNFRLSIKEFKRHRNRLKLFADELKIQATPSEKLFKKRLEDEGIKFIFQKVFTGDGGSCIADFYLPTLNLIVEVDGEYHETMDQKIRDFFKDEYYKSRGFRVLRIKNKDVRNFPLKELFTKTSQEIHETPRTFISPRTKERKELKIGKKVLTLDEYKRKKEKIAKRKAHEKICMLREKHKEVLETKPLENKYKKREVNTKPKHKRQIKQNNFGNKKLRT